MAGDAPDFGVLRGSSALRIVLVRSLWHGELSQALVTDAVETLLTAGIPKGNIKIIDAPGSYELPLLAKAALEAGADGVIAFGIVIQGATHHARLIAEAAADGCMKAQLDAGKPIVFEVLYVDKIEDARIRSTGPEGKGRRAAATLLKQLDEMRKLRK